MSSFHKVSEARGSVTGSKIKNNLPFVSSGIPSLDHVIGGGLPCGGIFAIEEDVLGNYSRVLTKYFLAEGVVCQHGIFVASADEDPQKIVNELPKTCTVNPEDEVTAPVNQMDKMKIAWRYEGLNQVESSFGNNTNFGHHFDLSKHMDPGSLKDISLTFCNLSNVDDLKNVNGFKNPLYMKLLKEIKEVISKEEYKLKNANGNILRISIQSLGSPLWLALDSDENTSVTDYGHDLMRFMYCLRVLIRDTSAVAFVTIPSHLFENEHIMKRLLYSIDNAVRIESFAGSDKETNPVFKEYHGLFHITKLSALYSMVPFVPPSLDMAFKLKRKKFLIEKLHLPPELEESSEREQDDITATPTCGGFKKKDIDF